MPELPPPQRGVRVGLLLVSAGVILWEVLLTRIYSVTLFYHFAFLSVSMALFGFTLGALYVFLRPDALALEPLRRRMARLALAAGLTMPVALGLQLVVPFHFQGGSAPLTYLLITALLSTLPFVPAGACITLALTRFQRAGTLYGWDLAGAALGCGLVAPVLVGLGGPGGALASGALVCLGAAGFYGRNARRAAPVAGALALGLLMLGGANTHGGWLRVRYGHAGRVPELLHEQWNAFSRVAVRRGSDRPFGWGIHPDVRKTLPDVEQRWLEIDSGAGTPLTKFGGDLRDVAFLQNDITTLAHRLRPGGEALVIGAGGGRDVLAALALGQKRVVGVEVNPAVAQAVNGAFGEFTGHLDQRGDVKWVVDEARSWLARNPGRYDVLQASFVDTAAATAASAYAFTENGIYTVEAWTMFLARLKPRGVLTFSRFYFGSTTWPVEVYRTLALAAAALRASGVSDPARHVIVARVAGERDAIATVLVSPDPFDDADLARVETTCEAIKAEVAYSWRQVRDPPLARILTMSEEELDGGFPLDVTPPRDDRPFFFFHTRLKHVLRGDSKTFGGSAFNMPAVRLLGTLLVLALLLGGGLIVVPAGWLIRQGTFHRGRSPRVLMPLYFAGIGLGFMFVEIGLIQRLSLFLGHPTYGFTVVLLGILLSAGAGSLASEPLADRWGIACMWKVLLVLVGALVLQDLLTALALQHAVGAATPVRLLLAVLLLAPPAFLMGFGFPLGMRRVGQNDDPRGAWLWAINGAASVVASVLAMVCSLELGIQVTLWTGALVYLATALIYRTLAREATAGAPR